MCLQKLISMYKVILEHKQQIISDDFLVSIRSASFYLVKYNILTLINLCIQFYLIGI